MPVQEEIDRVAALSREQVIGELRGLTDDRARKVLASVAVVGMPEDQITGMAMVELGVRMLAQGEGGLESEGVVLALSRLPELFRSMRDSKSAAVAAAVSK